MGARALEAAIVQTLAYADVFDYPLTATEIHRYLIGLAAPLESVGATLEVASGPRGWIEHGLAYYTLKGRQGLIEARQVRQELSKKMWQAALDYGRIIGSLPFVRMVAVTGALAMDNVVSNSDVDYLIVTRRGRLWLCRAFILLLARYAALRGVVLCPNYLIAQTGRALAFPEQNLYAAHEVAQMVPVSGHKVYEELRARNLWTLSYLPNAIGAPLREVSASTQRPALGCLKSFLEALIALPLFDALEAWEMRRKIRKLTVAHGTHLEASFSAERCKGHFNHHEEEALGAFAALVGGREGSHPEGLASPGARS